MQYTLENSILKATFDSFGAELKSVYSKSKGQDYLWNGDKKYWGRTSPVLFPFVGGLKDKTYHYQGKSYPMGQHGFARDMEHRMLNQDNTSIWFELTSNEDTLAKYPFPFSLQIGYELEENSIRVLWKVKNTGDAPMYFSIGAHPAFLCPIHGEASKSGYRLYFGGIEEVRHHGNDIATGLALDEDLVLPLENHRAVITPEFFDRCTYMVEGNQTKEVGIEDPQGRRYVTVYFDTPLFAVWSPEGKNAPFLCIEPWYGRCDRIDFQGDLQEREYENRLNAGETFERSYRMEFN